jgi:hypothetical protein
LEKSAMPSANFIEIESDPKFDPVSASNFGSDSHLMIFLPSL